MKQKQRKFVGEINGQSYDDITIFNNDMKRLGEAGQVKSMSYRFEEEEVEVPDDTAKGKELPESILNKRMSELTVEEFDELKDYIISKLKDKGLKVNVYDCTKCDKKHCDDECRCNKERDNKEEADDNDFIVKYDIDDDIEWNDEQLDKLSQILKHHIKMFDALSDDDKMKVIDTIDAKNVLYALDADFDKIEQNLDKIENQIDENNDIIAKLKKEIERRESKIAELKEKKNLLSNKNDMLALIGDYYESLCDSCDKQ
jgi:uncharacterized small protein (DUF1192 family)